MDAVTRIGNLTPQVRLRFPPFSATGLAGTSFKHEHLQIIVDQGKHEGFFEVHAEFPPPVLVKSLSHHLDDDDIVLVLGSAMRPTPFCGSACVGSKPAEKLVQLCLNPIQRVVWKLVSVVICQWQEYLDEIHGYSRA